MRWPHQRESAYCAMRLLNVNAERVGFSAGTQLDNTKGFHSIRRLLLLQPKMPEILMSAYLLRTKVIIITLRAINQKKMWRETENGFNHSDAFFAFNFSHRNFQHSCARIIIIIDRDARNVTFCSEAMHRDRHCCFWCVRKRTKHQSRFSISAAARKSIYFAFIKRFTPFSQKTKRQLPRKKL